MKRRIVEYVFDVEAAVSGHSLDALRDAYRAVGMQAAEWHPAVRTVGVVFQRLSTDMFALKTTYEIRVTNEVGAQFERDLVKAGAKKLSEEPL